MFRRQSVAVALALVLLLLVGASPSFAAPAEKAHTSIVGSVLALIAQIGEYLGLRAVETGGGGDVGEFDGQAAESSASTDETGIVIEPSG